jgi:hypothetical protein
MLVEHVMLGKCMIDSKHIAWKENVEGDIRTFVEANQNKLMPIQSYDDLALRLALLHEIIRNCNNRLMHQDLN